MADPNFGTITEVSEVDNFKWKDKDNLRTMTSKYNDTVESFHERIKQVEEYSDSVNNATQAEINKVDQSVNKKIDEINTDLSKRLESLSKYDVGLSKVDNTSDLEKPVSAAQQKAIDDAIAQLASEFTEEAGEEISSDDNPDPEVSAPIKQYIEDRIQEIEAGAGKIEYNISSETQLGVVKSSDDVQVNQVTGKMTVPKLSVHDREISSIQDKQGDITKLQTEDKTSLVTAINEVFQLGSEKKSKLVENLTAMGVTCSTTETWEVLLGKILDIVMGSDINISDGNVDASGIIKGAIGYNKNGRVVGTMPNRAVASVNGGDGDSILHPSWPEQTMTKHTLLQYGPYGPTTDELTNKIIMRTPEGYYDSNSRVYAEPSEMAKVIGLTANKIAAGNTILGIEGTAKNVEFVEIDARDSSSSSLTSTKFTFDHLIDRGFSAIMLAAYNTYNFRTNLDSPCKGKLIWGLADLLETGSLITNGYMKVPITLGAYPYAYLHIYSYQVQAGVESSSYGYQLFGIRNMSFPSRT